MDHGFFFGMDFFAKSFFGDGFLFFGGAAYLKVRVSDVEVVVFFFNCFGFAFNCSHAL